MKKFKLLTIIFAICLFNIGCGSDDAEEAAEAFDGSIESVEEFFTPELVQALQDLGFIINTGGTPPALEGSFFSSPVILQASTVPSDTVGQGFNDYTSTFSNQNNETLTLDFNGEQASQSDEGFGSFVSGQGDQFSVYLKTTSQIGNSPAETAIAISGKMTDEGIEDFQIAVLMLDDMGDPEGVYIENNQGRLIYDSDGFSPKI